MIGIIAACSANGVIGLNDKNGKGILPFNYPEDMRHFKKMTNDSVVIMGRRTFESIGKPLPNRENIVISSQNLEISGVRCYASIAAVLREESIILRDHGDHAIDIWFIGGASIYQEAMKFADHIVLTVTPDYIYDPSAIKFPWINPLQFEIHEMNKLSDTPNGELVVVKYIRQW